MKTCNCAANRSDCPGFLVFILWGGGVTHTHTPLEFSPCMQDNSIVVSVKVGHIFEIIQQNFLKQTTKNQTSFMFH